MLKMFFTNGLLYQIYFIKNLLHPSLASSANFVGWNELRRPKTVVVTKVDNRELFDTDSLFNISLVSDLVFYFFTLY